MPPGARHHSTKRGTRVMVILRDGSRVIGKFRDSNKRKVHLCDGRSFSWKIVRALAIYKGDNHCDRRKP